MFKVFVYKNQYQDSVRLMSISREATKSGSALITSLEKAREALKGNTGTLITRD